jgi:hypothetical protein
MATHSVQIDVEVPEVICAKCGITAAMEVRHLFRVAAKWEAEGPERPPGWSSITIDGVVTARCPACVKGI